MEDNKNNFDEIRELLKKHYKPEQEVDVNAFTDDVMGKIDSLYHKELYLEKAHDEDGNMLSEEERYWLGLENYIANKVTALKHKEMTDHILKCKDCRKNYNQLLDKKKLPMTSYKNYAYA